MKIYFDCRSEIFCLNLLKKEEEFLGLKLRSNIYHVNYKTQSKGSLKIKQNCKCSATKEKHKDLYAIYQESVEHIILNKVERKTTHFLQNFKFHALAIISYK